MTPEPDLVAVLAHSDAPFHRRGLDWDVSKRPVPTEILVCTDREWRHLQDVGTRFVRTLATETVWLVGDWAAL